MVARGVYERSAQGSLRFDGIDALNDGCRRHGVEFIQLEPGRVAADFRLASLPRVHFSVSRFTRWLVAAGAPPPGGCMVAIGPSKRRSTARGRFLLERECTFIAPGRQFVRTLPPRIELLSLVLDHATLEAAAEERIGVPLARVTRHGVLPVDDGPARSHLHETVVGLALDAIDLRTGPPRPREEEVDIEERLLDALLLHVVPDGLHGRHPDRCRLARRAAKLLVDRADSPTALPDLARTLRTTLRTIEAGFRESFGVSPRHFRQCMRLHRARNDLRTAPEGTTVASVAVRHGIRHVGRFSVTYRKMFGESPVTTLRAARPVRGRGRG